MIHPTFNLKLIINYLHRHLTLWFLTSQVAPTPQNPGQGSAHFRFLHIRSGAQSVCRSHSGLHGSPKYPSWHVQSAEFLSPVGVQ